MLERGGNAIDAAVAAALVAGVVEPTETTLAGSGFLLLADRKAPTQAVEFGPLAPLAASSSMYTLNETADSSAVLGLAPVLEEANVSGPRASGVPRTLLGLLTAQERWGALERAEVCAPAIRAAYEGFPADVWFVANALSDLPRLRSDEGTSHTFLDSQGLPLGHSSQAFYGPSMDARPMVTQPLLGRTLEEVSQSGLSSLTEGPVAQRLVESSQERGGLLTLSDLRKAAPRVGPALTIDYRGFEVAAPHSPGGGLTELQILRMWEALNPQPRTSHESPELTRSLALVLRHAFADRYHWLGDFDVVPVPMSGLLSDGYIAQLARECAAGQDVPRWGEGHPWITYAGFAAHDPWPFAHDPAQAPRWSPLAATTPTSGTTHISATDTAGRTVSVTHTAANHFGSGVMCPRTGLLFDSSMAWFNAADGAANSITGGARALANMGPVILSGDQTSYAIGASGGRRIISAVVQLVINLVDGQRSVPEALAMPRLDGSGRSVLIHENRSDALPYLEDLDPVVVPSLNEPFTMDFARANIAAVDRAGNTISAIPTLAYSD